MSNINDKIDFIVLWVDPNDKEWQTSRMKYAKEIGESSCVDNRLERYRDWGLFKYWFRGVERYAPWVNKVHLVTCGHLPEWLNTKHPKLNIVKHSDFMPEGALPTFNSNAIELCVHKIPGLAEQFVLFNDDMYLIKPVKKSDFFRNRLPVNTMSLFAIAPISDGKNFHKVIHNNMSIINNHFVFKESKKKNLPKYLSLKQREWILFTYPLLLYRHFMGFRNYHIPISYLRSTFKEVWKTESKILESTVYSRIRDNEKNVSHWLFNYWQFASGDFYQRNSHFGISLRVNDARVINTILRRKHRVVCLNDLDEVEDVYKMQERFVASFEKVLPGKSEFEK